MEIRWNKAAGFFALAYLAVTRAEFKNFNKEAKAIVAEGLELLLRCRPEVTKENLDNNPAPILACLKAGRKCRRGMLLKFPATFLETLYLLLMEKWKQNDPDRILTKFADQTKEVGDVLKMLLHQYAEHALSQTPNDRVVDSELLEYAEKGSIAEEIKKEADDGKKTFSDIFHERIRQFGTASLGDGRNINGVVYQVELADDRKMQPYAMKVVQHPRNRSWPREFEMHAKLQTIASAASQFSFVPRIVMKDHSIYRNGKFDFMVMELLGPTVREWMEPGKFKPEEAMQVMAKSYLILQELHKHGIVHGDNHLSNWAFSRENKQVVVLFDFDRTRELKDDFGFVLRDLWLWLLSAGEILEKLYWGPGNHWDFVAEALETQNRLLELLRPVFWFHPDKPGRRFVHYDKYSRSSYAELMSVPPLPKFTKDVEEWLETDIHKL